MILALITGLAVGFGAFLLIQTNRKSQGSQSAPAVTKSIAIPESDTKAASDGIQTPATPSSEGGVLHEGSRGIRHKKPSGSSNLSVREKRVSDETSQSVVTRSDSALNQSASTSPEIRDPETVEKGEATPATSSGRRRAVQETEAESSPFPNGPSLASKVEVGPQIQSAPQTAPGPHFTRVPEGGPAPQQATRPTYTGPPSGTATWTGKLEKNGTLTITGGTSSIGVLAGAPLPGVPVRLSIEQSNLGFAEMPSAANGYRRLVLRSHSKHDKIIIHWTVVQ